MFLHLSVILLTGGAAPVHAGIQPPRADTPWADTPQADTPLPSACWDTHPLPSACWDMPTSGRYASYWNAFLFKAYLLYSISVLVNVIV